MPYTEHMDNNTNDTPALNPDGSFKDASEMQWDHSPSAGNVPLPAIDPPQPAESSAAKISTSRSGRVLNLTRYNNAVSFVREPTDQLDSPPQTPPPKPSATTATKSTRSRVESSSDEDSDRPAKKKAKKNGTRQAANSKTTVPRKKPAGGKVKGKGLGKGTQPSVVERFLIVNQPGADKVCSRLFYLRV